VALHAREQEMFPLDSRPLLVLKKIFTSALFAPYKTLAQAIQVFAMFQYERKNGFLCPFIAKISPKILAKKFESCPRKQIKPSKP
jgi:hypothetical protein